MRDFLQVKHKISGYMTKRPTGAYLFTFLEPEIKPVVGSGHLDVYATPGDPFAWMLPICASVVQRLFPELVDAEPLVLHKVYLEGWVAD